MEAKYPPPPEHSLLYIFYLKRNDRNVFMTLCTNKFSIQDGIDFMALASRDLSRHDVILATLNVNNPDIQDMAE